MQSPFEDTGEDNALQEVEFTLNVKGTYDGTLNVTSNDLALDPANPDIMPIGESFLLFPTSTPFSKCGDGLHS